MKTIDEAITIQINLIQKKITNKNFETLCEFNLTEIPKFEKKLEKLKKIKGIYLFEVYNADQIIFEDWLKDFSKIFSVFENKYSQNWTPKIIEKRTKKHIGKKMKWTPLYIGKSTNIENRIKEHIHFNIGKPPSALKLLDRGNLNTQKFRLKYIDFNFINNYAIIVSQIEKKLRDEINPIAGS